MTGITTLNGNSNTLNDTDLSNNLVIDGNSNTVNNTSTIAGTTAVNGTDTTLSNITLTGATNVALGATTTVIENSTIKATVDIAETGVSIDGNSFILADTDTGITSSGGANSLATASITDNTFKASSAGDNYTGIDLGNQFTGALTITGNRLGVDQADIITTGISIASGIPTLTNNEIVQGTVQKGLSINTNQTYTLLNNDIEGTITIGIEILDGTATIKQSDITSIGGAGIGIQLSGGTNHDIGVSGDYDQKNIFKLLATAIKSSVDTTVDVFNNHIGISGAANSANGLLVDTSSTVNSQNNVYHSNDKAINITADVTFGSSGDTIDNSSTAGIEINHAAANPTIANLTSANTNPIGVLITLSDTGSIQNSTFNMNGSDIGIQFAADADKITVTKNIFDGAGADEVAIDNDDAATLAAHKNYFDAADGPIHDDDAATGSGDKVQGKIQYSPFHTTSALNDALIDYRLKVTTTGDPAYHTYFANALNEGNATHINVKRNVSGDHDIDVAGLEVICDNQDEVFSGEITISGSGVSQADPILLNNCTLSDQLIITGSFAKVDNNIFNHDHAADYTIMSTGADIDGTNIINNTFNSANAINLTNSNNTESDIEGNTFNQVEKAINTSNKFILIHNNAFKVDTDDAGSFAINSGADAVAQGTVTITNNTIETAGNAAHDFEKAIIIGHATQTSLATLTITGNTIKDSDTAIELITFPGTAHTVSSNKLDTTIDGNRINNTTASILTAYQNWWGSDAEPNTLVNDISKVNYGNWCTTVACEAFNSDIFVDLGNNASNDRFYGRLQVERAFDETLATATITLDGGNFALDSISADTDDLTVTCTETGGGGFSNFTSALTIAGSNVDFTNCKFASTVAVNDVNSSFTNGSITGIATVNANETTFDNVDLASNLVANNKVIIQNSTDITGTLTLNGANSSVDASTLNSTTALGATGITIQNSTAKNTISSADDTDVEGLTINNVTFDGGANHEAISIGTGSSQNSTMTFNANTFSGAITKALVLKSGKSTIYANTIGSSLAAGADTANIGIDVVAGNHTLGDEAQTHNTINGYAVGINVDNAATASGSFNKFESNTKDVTTNKAANSFLEILKSWFGHADGPTDDTEQGSGGVVEGNVEYSPFLNTDDLNAVKDENGNILANKLDGVIVIKDTNDAVLGYATTLAEAMTTLATLIGNGAAPTKAELKRNFTDEREADIDFSVDGITYECAAGKTITDTNGTVVLSASNATVTGCIINDDLEITGSNNTISNNTIKGTIDIAETDVDINTNDFILDDADTGITSSGLADSLATASITNNTFRAKDEGESYTGIDLGNQFSGALTLTNNDMSTATNDVIVTGIKVASGTATITQSTIDSTGAAGIGIHLAGGASHVIGTNNVWGNRNILSDLATGIQLDDNTVDASTVTITFNDLSTGNTLAIDNKDANAIVSAIKNYFSVTTDPIAQVDNNASYVTYAPWCSQNDCGAFTQDISNTTQSKKYGAAQFDRAIDEAAGNDTLTFDSAQTYASKDIHAAVNMTGNNNATFGTALTISAAATLDNVNINADTDITAGATIKNSDITKTLTINANDITIGTSGNRNTFSLAGGDIGITSDGSNTDNITGLNISFNDFSSSDGNAYTGIDLGDDFASNAITLSDNDMTTPITVGIKLASGTAAITKSNITSAGGAGVGIQLAGGTGHTIGTADTWANRNTLSNLAAGIQIDDETVDASTVTITFNDLSTNNTLAIDNNDANAIVSAIKNYFSVITDPIAKVDNNASYVTYAPWCNANDCSSFTQDISNTTQSKKYGAAQFDRAIDEAAENDTLTFDSAQTYSSKDIHAAVTMTSNNNATFDTALTISAAATLDDVNITGDTAITAGATIRNSDITKTLDIQSTGVNIGTAGNGNRFVLANTDTGITSSGGAASLETASIVDNTFRANVAGQSYTGIDLGNQFSGALTLTNNDMSTATNDEITFGIQLASGNATITASNLFSNNDTGIGINILGGNHTLGSDNSDFNTLDDFATGLQVADGASVNGSFNKFESNTKDIDNNKDSFIEIFKSWFGHADGPTNDTGQGSGGTVEGKVEYSPFITTDDMNKDNLDGVIVIQDNTDTAIGYATTLAEAMTNIAALETAYQNDNTKPRPTKALIKHNFTTRDADIDFSENGISYECTAGQTIKDTNGTVVLSATNATITGCIINDILEISGTNNTLDNVTLNSTTALKAKNITIQNSTAKNTISSSNGQDVEGLTINNVTFDGATANHEAISIGTGSSSNTAITINDNTFSGKITKAIVIQSGKALIHKNDIDSSLAKAADGANIAIDLLGGATHTIGHSLIANKNEVDGFLTAINIDAAVDASTLTAQNNKFTNNTTAVNNQNANLFTITDSYFNHATGPSDNSGYGSGEAVTSIGNNPDLINYSPFYTDADMTTKDSRFIIQDNNPTDIGHASTYNQAITKIGDLAESNPVKMLIKADVSQGDTIDIDNTNMTFECSAQATTIDAGNSVININASGFTLNNCTIDDQVNIKNTGVSVTNSILPNLEVTHANAIIADNTLNSTTTENIYLKDASSTTISDNTFSGNTTTAIKSYGTSPSLTSNDITGDYAIAIHTIASETDNNAHTLTLGNSNILRSNTAGTGIGIKAEDALTHINIDSNYGSETIIDKKATAIENKNARLTISKAQITNSTTGVKNLSTNSQDVSIQNTVFEDNTKAIHNLGTSTITIQRNKITHSNPVFNTTFAIDNEQSTILALEANCITQLYNNKGLVQVRTEIDDCTKNIQQIEVADTVEPVFVSQEKEGLAEVATDKIIIDETDPEVDFLKAANTKAVVDNTFTTESGETIDINNVRFENNLGSSTVKNITNTTILNKQINFNKVIEFKVNNAVVLENNKLKINNTEDLEVELNLQPNTLIFAENTYDSFKFDKITSVEGTYSDLIDDSNIFKIGSYNSQLLFNKPIEICFQNNLGEFWAIQNQPGDRFFKVNKCNTQALKKDQNECYFQEANSTCILTNHASIIAQTNRPIPNEKISTSHTINKLGLTNKTFSNQTSDKQLKLNVEKMTTFEDYLDDKIIIKNISKDRFAETSLPSQIVKTFEIGKRALETNKDLRVTYIVPDKYKDQTQDLALYQYDLTDKVYKLLDASPSLDGNKAFFKTNTSGTMAILVTNYKRDELRSVESIFDTQEIKDLSIPWYTPFMRKAQSLNVINNSDEAFTQVSRAKLSDMITKLLEVEIVEDAENPFSDISESTTYSESILTLKKLGIIKGYGDGTFKPQRSVTRAEALKIILMTAGIPESMEQSIFKDVDNSQWFTKFVMAANKLGIVKGYADGEFKPQRTITISEMTKILIKVKELKQNSLVSENTIQKIQEIFSLFAR